MRIFDTPLGVTALACLTLASAQLFPFSQMTTATTVPNGPSLIGFPVQTASLVSITTSVSPVLTATATSTVAARAVELEKRGSSVSYCACYGSGTANTMAFPTWIIWSSYTASSGILQIKSWLWTTININLATGLNPSAFYLGKYNSWLFTNAVMYSGVGSVSSPSSQCQMSAFSQPSCAACAVTGYVTVTTTVPANSAFTTATITPSGTVSGTYLIETPAPTTITSTGTFAQPTTTTTAGNTVVVIVSTSVWNSYANYYPALETGLTTNPALAATFTTTAGQACPTTPEAGTPCGFLNPEDPCAPQPNGYGPVPSPDTVSAFYAYPPFSSWAAAAPTNIPSTNGSTYVQVFEGLNASSSAQSYLGLYTLQTYDTVGCAAYCDATSLCTAFNIYIERDPSLNPSNNDSTAPTVWGTYCPNPPSMTSFKCTLWGSNLDASTATNTGQWQEGFQIVITGSNGYDKTNSTIPNIPGTGGGSSSSSSSSSTSVPTTLSTITTTACAATSTVTSVRYQSLGCYADNSARILPNQLTSGYNCNANTPATCAAACSAAGFAYSGTEYSNQCFCGNTAPTGTPGTSGCTYTCTGNSTQTCGGYWYISVVRDTVLAPLPSVSASACATTSTSSSTTVKATPTHTPCWSWTPQNCNGKAISAPPYWLASQFFPGPFNPSLCLGYATLLNGANKAAAAAQGLNSYSTCQYFNAYYLHKNGAPAGTVCGLYDTILTNSYATISGGVDGSGNSYNCKQSWSWSFQ